MVHRVSRVPRRVRSGGVSILTSGSSGSTSKISAALLDQVEVENFPTILIGEGERPHFFGAITPQREVLLRLIAAHRPLAMGHDTGSPEVSGLLRRLQDIAG